MRDRLHLLLSNGLGIQNIQDLREQANTFFLQDGSLASFFAWSVFRTIDDHYGSDQAVPTVLLDSYEQKLLPFLKRWLASESTFHDTQLMQKIAEIQQSQLGTP